MVNTLLELLGLAAIVAGVAAIFWPAALILAGIVLVLAANRTPADRSEVQ